MPRFERKVREELRKDGKRGCVVCYKGRKGSERKVRVDVWQEDKCICVIHYKGRKDSEHQVCVVDVTTGTRFLFNGSRGAERNVRSESADGSVSYLNDGAETTVVAPATGAACGRPTA